MRPSGFDRTVVDGAVNGIGTVTTGAGTMLRRVQTGRVQNYALGIALGLIAMAVGYILIAVRVGGETMRPADPERDHVHAAPGRNRGRHHCPRDTRSHPGGTTLGFTLAAWVMSLLLLAAYAFGQTGFQFIEAHNWIPSFGIQYKGRHRRPERPDGRSDDNA